MAGNDFDAARRIQYWPLREMLLAYLDGFKGQLREILKHRQLLYQIRVSSWAGGKGIKPPEIPKLLREPDQ